MKYLLALVAFISLTVSALEIEVVDYEGQDALYITGDYVQGDEDLFLEAIKDNPGVTLIVLGDSDGGLTSESYPIARYIADNDLDTVVATSSTCVSSCGIVWLAGDSRTIESGGEVWLHLPYFPADRMLEYLQVDEYCETEETCRPWTTVEILEIYLMQNLRAVGVFYDFMVEMDAEPEWISGTMQTNPWEFYKITGE